MSYLKGFESISDSMISNDICDNLISFLDYGLVEKSGYINVNIPTTGVFGGLNHRLRPVSDPRYSSGQVWQSFHGNWLWETGLVSNSNTNPGVSGVYVSGVFRPVTSSGTYAHYIDHKHGRVVFNSAIPRTSTVECNFSYKYFSVEKTYGVGWFKQIQTGSDRTDSSNFVKQSGEWSQFAENRVQTPVFGIEQIPNGTSQGYQLGGGQIFKTDFLIHCVAEDGYTRDWMLDVIRLQNESTIKMYNLNTIADNNAFPLDYRGVPISGALRYPQLVDQYPGNWLRIYNIRTDSIYELGNLFIGTLKISTEIILGV